MNLSRREVIRRLAGLATAASGWAAALLVLDQETPTAVAGRQASNIGPRTAASAPGRTIASQQPAGTAPASSDGPAHRPPQSSPGTGDNEPTTTSAAEGSSTTAADTTSTTRRRDKDDQQSTTTTQSTTTSQAPTTTTQESDSIQLGLSNGATTWWVQLTNADNGDQWWYAPYHVFLPSGAGWIAGDRIGYGAVYGFIVDEGKIVGRVTFAKIRGAAYAKVNDRAMPEGERYFDGQPGGGGQLYSSRFVDHVVSHEYTENLEPDSNPRVVYLNGGRTIEVRDYANVERLSPNLKFRLDQFITTPFMTDDGEGRSIRVNQRATVVAYADNLPVVVVYYDALNNGQVAATPG